MFVYYAYVDPETKKWYIYPNDGEKKDLLLLFVLRCNYTAKPHFSPDPNQVDVTGIYTTADNRRVEVLEKCWYGLKYEG